MGNHKNHWFTIKTIRQTRMQTDFCGVARLSRYSIFPYSHKNTHIHFNVVYRVLLQCKQNHFFWYFIFRLPFTFPSFQSIRRIERNEIFTSRICMWWHLWYIYIYRKPENVGDFVDVVVWLVYEESLFSLLYCTFCVNLSELRSPWPMFYLVWPCLSCALVLHNLFQKWNNLFIICLDWCS